MHWEMSGDGSPRARATLIMSPPNKRQQRSAQRLQEFQEKKRAALVHELVSKGTELSVAQVKLWRVTSGSGLSTSRRSARRRWRRRPTPSKAARPAHRRQPHSLEWAQSGLALSHPKRAECEGGREGCGFSPDGMSLWYVLCAAFPALCSSDVVVA